MKYSQLTALKVKYKRMSIFIFENLKIEWRLFRSVLFHNHGTFVIVIQAYWYEIYMAVMAHGFMPQHERA